MNIHYTAQTAFRHFCPPDISASLTVCTPVTPNTGQSAGQWSRCHTSVPVLVTVKYSKTQAASWRLPLAIACN